MRILKHSTPGHTAHPGKRRQEKTRQEQARLAWPCGPQEAFSLELLFCEKFTVDSVDTESPTIRKPSNFRPIIATNRQPVDPKRSEVTISKKRIENIKQLKKPNIPNKKKRKWALSFISRWF